MGKITMIEKNYSIHDIVKFKVIGNRISKRLDIEYKNFESEKIDNPDFTVYLGDFTPSNERCTILDNTYHIKENYFYCEDSYKIGRWRVEVSELEGKETTVKLSTNIVGTIAADMFICAFVIDFLIRFKMEQKGYSVVHAAAVSKDGHAYLFPSQSGAGKTTTAVYFAEKCYNLLGDDFVILHNGDVISYLTPLNIFAYNLNPVILKNFGFKDKIILKLKNMLYKATSGYIKIFTKMNPTEMFSNQIIDKSKLATVFLLVPKEKFSVEKTDRGVVINNLFINQKMESFPFLKYLLEYAYVFPESGIAAYWEKCKENLVRNLGEDVDFYRVDVPKRYDRGTFEKISEVVECGI
jgi:hypothetical protein